MSKKVNHYQQKYLLIKWKSQIFYLYLKAVKICCIQIVITIEYYTIESKYFRSLKKFSLQYSLQYFVTVLLSLGSVSKIRTLCLSRKLFVLTKIEEFNYTIKRHHVNYSLVLSQVLSQLRDVISDTFWFLIL